MSGAPAAGQMCTPGAGYAGCLCRTPPPDALFAAAAATPPALADSDYSFLAATPPAGAEKNSVDAAGATGPRCEDRGMYALTSAAQCAAAARAVGTRRWANDTR